MPGATTPPGPAALCHGSHDDEIIRGVRLAVTPRRLFGLAIAGQFLFGIVLALPGTLFGLPVWTSSLGFDVASQARLLVVFYGGQFAFTAVAGTLVDRVGCQRVLALGSLLIAIALVLLAGASAASATLVPATLLAAGGSSINAASNTLVSVTYGARRGAMLSLMATFGAAGSLSTPLLFSGGLGSDGVALRLWRLALVSLAVTVFPVVVRASDARVGGPSIVGALGLLRERNMRGLIALLGLEFGVEAILAGWAAAFAIAVFPGTSGGLMVGLYWGGLCLSRLCAPLILVRAPKLVVVLAASITAGLAVVTMATAPSTVVLAFAVFVAGASVGPLAPTIVSVAGDRYPRQMGAAIGLLLSTAQIGGMVMPWATGQATIARGYRFGLVIPAFCAFGIAAGAALAWKARAERVPAAVEVPTR